MNEITNFLLHYLKGNVLIKQPDQMIDQESNAESDQWQNQDTDAESDQYSSNHHQAIHL